MWLTKTADCCCDITTIIQSLARGKTEAPIKLRTHELVALAKGIVSAERSPEIPAHIIEVVEEVIVGRRTCARWYAAAKSESTKENATHAYFIQVLERVRDILVFSKQQRAKSSVASMNTPARTGDDGAESLKNSFACLEVEEPSLEDTIPGDAAAIPAHAQIELQDEGEQAFAIWCLLQDFFEVRSFILDTWSEYLKGDISFMAAAVITNTSFGIMRRANEEFAASNPDFSDYWRVLSFLEVSAVMQGGRARAFTSDRILSSKDPSTGIEADSLLCFAGALTLCVFESGVNIYFEDALRLPKRPRDGLAFIASARQHHDLGEIIIGMAPTIANYAVDLKQSHRQAKPELLNDEFMRGLSGLIGGQSPNELPMWVVAAYETCIGIHHLTQSIPDVGADALCDWLPEMGNRVSKYLKFMKTFNEHFLKPIWIHDFENLITKAAVLPEKIQAIKGSQPQSQLSRSDNASINELAVVIFPVSAGCALYSDKLTIHARGTNLADDGFVIHAIAHLYRAARYYGLLKGTWPDMDFFLDQYSKTYPLITDVDASADAYSMARDYQEAIGVSQGAIGRTKRAELPPRETLYKRARKIITTSDYHHGLFQEKERETKSEMDDMIDIVLKSLAEKDGRLSDAQKRMNSTDNTGEYLTEGHTPVELLSAYKTNFIKDEPMLNFDYLGFFQVCGILLKDIEAVSVHKIKDLAAREIEWGYELVDLLLWEAADAAGQGMVSKSAIAEAAMVLEEIIPVVADDFTR